MSMAKIESLVASGAASVAGPEAAARSETHRHRRCLMCRERFGSEWAGERVCKKCKSHAAWREGSVRVAGRSVP